MSGEYGGQQEEGMMGMSGPQYVLHLAKIPQFTSPYDIYEMLRDLKLSKPINHKDVAIQMADDRESVIKTYVRFESQEDMDEAQEAINRVSFFSSRLEAEKKNTKFDPFKKNINPKAKFRAIYYPVVTNDDKMKIKRALNPYNPTYFFEAYPEKELIVEFTDYETVKRVLSEVNFPEFEAYEDTRWNLYLNRLKKGELFDPPKPKPKSMKP